MVIKGIKQLKHLECTSYVKKEKQYNFPSIHLTHQIGDGAQIDEIVHLQII